MVPPALGDLNDLESWNDTIWRDEVSEFGLLPQRGEQGISDLTGVGQSLGEFHTSSPLLESLRGATGVLLPSSYTGR